MTQMPPMPPPLPDMAAMEKPQGSQRLAVVAMVLGVCAFVPGLGILTGFTAITMAYVVLAMKKPGKGLAIGAICASAAGMFIGGAIIASIWLPDWVGSSDPEPEAVCTANVNAIGKALTQYAAHSEDHSFPENLDELKETGLGKNRSVFHCPSDGEARESYFYVMPDEDTPDDALMLCEIRQNHSGKRVILKKNGSAQILSETEFQHELDQRMNRQFAELYYEAKR